MVEKRSKEERCLSQTHSSCVNVARSLRSAPAQKDSFTALASIKARVGPFSGSSRMALISWLNSESSCLLIALRACGLFKERILMVPMCGAERLVVWITEDGVE